MAVAQGLRKTKKSSVPKDGGRKHAKVGGAANKTSGQTLRQIKKRFASKHAAMLERAKLNTVELTGAAQV